MKKRAWRKGLAAMLGLVLSIHAPAGALTLKYQAYAYTERAATINASSLNVRSGAGTTYSQVTKLSKGAAVTVIGETTGTDGKLWYQIRFTGAGGGTSTGYVLNTYVKFPVAYSHDGNFEAQLSAQGFPESYKDGLRQIHAQYPSWTFTAMHTGLDWNTVIQNEGVVGRNLVHKNSISSYKSIADGAYNWDTGAWTGFDGSTWVGASEDILRYYMDPRNFLDEVSVFQFMDQTYNPSIHTKEGLESMLAGTFMSGSVLSNGSAAGAAGGSGSSNPGSGTSNVVGPGMSGGGTSSAPGGQGAVVVGPGGSQGSQDNSQGAGQGSQDAAQGSGQGSADGDVRLVGPQASISRHETALVGTSTVITAGPGGQSAGASQTPGGTPAGTPGGTPAGTPGGTASGISYADAIMNAAQTSGVSPYVIAAMIIQEQGSDGRGNSISGNYAGYTGYYNYFNVGAYASDGMGAVQRGLWYASQAGSYGRPWTTPEGSISGGAEFYGTNYVKAGQDTLYLKKYNVQGSNMYKHQYMTNVDGAAAEGSILAEGFTAHQKNTALNFKIPVYTNMPASPCTKPTVDGSPNNKLNGLGAEGFTLTPTFNKDTTSYDLIVDHSVSNVTIGASAIDSKASVRGTGNIQLQSGNNEISVVVRAENGTERTYTIHVVRQNNGPTYNAALGGGVSTGGTPSTDGTTVTIDGPGANASGPGISNGGPGISNPSSNPGAGANPGTSATPGAGGSPGTNTAPGGNNVTFVSPGG